MKSNSGRKKGSVCDGTSRKLKQAKIPPLAVPLRKGAWQVAREKGEVPSGVPKNPPLKRGRREIVLADDMKFEMAHDKAGGMSNAAIAQKYQVAEGYVVDALKKLYVESREGRKILHGIVLENAIATGMQARAKIFELNGMQSVIANGIMTQRFIELDKHLQSSPTDVDVSNIEKMGRLLDELNGSPSSEGEIVEDVIDINADVESMDEE